MKRNRQSSKKSPWWPAVLLLGCMLTASPVISFGANRENARLDKGLETLGFIKLPDDQEAPDFALQDVSGQSIRLADHRGKVVFLTFWTTW